MIERRGAARPGPNAFRSYALVLCVFTLVATGCVEAPVHDLLRVDSVTPLRVAIGDRLRISGDGFAPGTDVSVRVRGTLRRPGAAARRTGFDVAGEVTSSHAVEVAVDHAFVRDVGGSGTFRGELAVVACGTTGACVRGQVRRVHLDVRAPMHADIAGAVDAERTARRLLEQTGLELRPAPLGVRGVLVSAVRSPASDLGVLVGDRIEEVDGASIDAWSEVRARPGSRTLNLVIRREGERGTRPVTIPLTARARPSHGDDVLAWLVACVAIALTLITSRPSSRATRRVLDIGARTILGLRRHHLRWFDAVAIVICSAACMLIVRRGGTVLGPAFAVLAVDLVAASRGAGSSREKLHAGARLLLIDAVLVATVAFLAWAFGGASLSGVQAIQSATPTGWLAFHTLSGLLAFPLVLAIVSSRARGEHPLRSVSDGVLVVLAALVLFGASGARSPVALQIGLLAFKSIVISTAACSLRETRASRGELSTPVVWGILVVLLAMVETRVVENPVRELLGSVAGVLSSLAATILIGWVSLALLRRRRGIDAVAQPLPMTSP